MNENDSVSTSAEHVVVGDAGGLEAVNQQGAHSSMNSQRSAGVDTDSLDGGENLSQNDEVGSRRSSEQSISHVTLLTRRFTEVVHQLNISSPSTPPVAAPVAAQEGTTCILGAEKTPHQTPPISQLPTEEQVRASLQEGTGRTKEQQDELFCQMYLMLRDFTNSQAGIECHGEVPSNGSLSRTSERDHSSSVPGSAPASSIPASTSGQPKKRGGSPRQVTLSRKGSAAGDMGAVNSMFEIFHPGAAFTAQGQIKPNDTSLTHVSVSQTNSSSHVHNSLFNSNSTGLNSIPNNPLGPPQATKIVRGGSSYNIIRAQHLLPDYQPDPGLAHNPFVLSTDTGADASMSSAIHLSRGASFSRYSGQQTLTSDGVTMISEYEVVAELGRGSFGTVCLAFNQNDEAVAIKTMYKGTHITRHNSMQSEAISRQSESSSSAPSLDAAIDVLGTNQSKSRNVVFEYKSVSEQDACTTVSAAGSSVSSAKVGSRGSALSPTSLGAGSKVGPLLLDGGGDYSVSSSTVMDASNGSNPAAGQSASDSVSSAHHALPLRGSPNRGLEAQQLVEREIAVMKALRHKNIVRLYAVIEDEAEQQCHLVMQYIENGPMAKMESDGSCDVLAVNFAVNYMCQVSSGLDYLHRHGVIHRDIKPENILIGKGHTAYVADFGVSGVINDMSNGHVRTAGTMPFMSPEMFTEDNAAARFGKESDVWAFGVSLYCITVGTLPFKGFNGPSLVRAIMQGKLMFPNGLSQEQCPDELREILTQLLNIDVQKRMTLTEFRHHPFTRKYRKSLAGMESISPKFESAPRRQSSKSSKPTTPLSRSLLSRSGSVKSTTGPATPRSRLPPLTVDDPSIIRANSLKQTTPRKTSSPPPTSPPTTSPGQHHQTPPKSPSKGPSPRALPPRREESIDSMDGPEPSLLSIIGAGTDVAPDDNDAQPSFLGAGAEVYVPNGGGGGGGGGGGDAQQDSVSSKYSVGTAAFTGDHGDSISGASVNTAMYRDQNASISAQSIRTEGTAVFGEQSVRTEENASISTAPFNESPRANAGNSLSILGGGLVPMESELPRGETEETLGEEFDFSFTGKYEDKLVISEEALRGAIQYTRAITFVRRRSSHLSVAQMSAQTSASSMSKMPTQLKPGGGGFVNKLKNEIKQTPLASSTGDLPL